MLLCLSTLLPDSGIQQPKLSPSFWQIMKHSQNDEGALTLSLFSLVDSGFFGILLMSCL